jgi:hypothetical protein
MLPKEKKINHQINSGFNKKMKKYKSNLVLDFSVPFKPQENEEKFQQQKP